MLRGKVWFTLSDLLRRLRNLLVFYVFVQELAVSGFRLQLGFRDILVLLSVILCYL